MTTQREDDLILWYRQPAATWVEALPIGNGRLGAMVFGHVDVERLQLNEDTLWSGGPRPWNNPGARTTLPEVRRLIAAGDYAGADVLCKQMQGPYNESYQPLGDLYLQVEGPGQADHYVRDLNLRTGIAGVRYQRENILFSREVFASAPDQAIIVRFSCDRPGGLTVTATLDTPHPHHVESTDPHVLTLYGHAPAHVAPSYDNVPDPVVYAENEGMAFVLQVEAMIEGGQVTALASGLHIAGADAITLVVVAATGFKGYQRSPRDAGRDLLVAATTRHRTACARPYDALRAAHCADHQRLFERVTLDLGQTPAARLPTDERLRTWQHTHDPHLVSLLFQYGRYLLMASSRPGTQPANLQGIWNEAVRPPWSSNWTTNINTQMNYWPAEPANLAECHGPLFDLIR